MNTRLYIIFFRVLLTLGITAGGLVLLSAVKTKDAKPCSNVLVHYKNGRVSGFVPEQDVLLVIREYLQAEPIGAALELFDLNTIEAKIEKHAWVYDAQLYFDNNQTLHVMLMEAIPIARCVDVAGNHFYIDKNAAEMPLSNTYRADLPVFTGIPTKRKDEKVVKTLARICALAGAILADSFWLAQASQVEVLPNGKMEMYPAVGNHIVDMGYASAPNEMLLKLKHFYKAMASAGRFDEYQRINASFNGQIVAQKSGYDLARPDKNEAMNTYQKIVNDNKSVVNANSVVKESAAGRIMSEPAERKDKTSKADKKQEELPKQEVPLKVMEPNPEKQPEKIPEKKPEIKEEKVPKAVMPKIENN